MAQEVYPVVCVNVEKGVKPPVPASKRRCEGCQTRIWVSLGMIQRTRASKATFRFLCLKCAAEHVKSKVDPE